MKKLLIIFVAVIMLTGGRAAHAATNLVPNPALELSDINGISPLFWARGHWGTNQATFTYGLIGVNRSKGAKVEITAAGTGDAKWYFKEIPVTPGTSLAFSDMSLATTTSYVTVQFHMTDGTYKYLDLGKLSASTTWQNFTHNFSVPVGTSALTVFHVIKNVGALTVDNYSLTQIPSIDFPYGFVSISFDDGLISMYNTALPILDKAGLKSTDYIISGKIYSGFPGYMTADQVKALYADGQEIGAHTRDHYDLTTLTADQMRYEIAGSKQDLQTLLGAPVTTFAYPFGAYNATTDQIVQESGFIGARTSDGGLDTKQSNRFLLMREGVTIDTTVAQVQAWVDQAIANKQWLILVFHHIDNDGDQYSATPQTFQQIVDYLKTKNVPVKTVAQGIQLMNQ